MSRERDALSRLLDRAKPAGEGGGRGPGVRTRRGPHPLYSGASASYGRGKQQRSWSNPTSPRGGTKPKPARTGKSRPASAALEGLAPLPGSAASSPTRDVCTRLHNFTLSSPGSRSQSAPTNPAPTTQEQEQKQQDSPIPSPAAPLPPGSLASSSASPASPTTWSHSLDALALHRFGCQLFPGPVPPSPEAVATQPSQQPEPVSLFPGSTPPSPEAVATQPSQQGEAVPLLLSAPTLPSVAGGWRCEQRLQSPPRLLVPPGPQLHASQSGVGIEAHCGQPPPRSLFLSSQDRQAEIAALCGTEWCSQPGVQEAGAGQQQERQEGQAMEMEIYEVKPPQQQQVEPRGQEEQRTSGEDAAVLRDANRPGSQGSQQPPCSTAPQEIDAERGAEQQQQPQLGQGAAGAPVSARPQQQAAEEAAAAKAARRAALFAQYADCANKPWPEQQAPRRRTASEPPPGASPRTAAALQQAAAAAEASVAQTCPPHLAGVYRTFPTQREAFEFADQLNIQLPLVAQCTLLVSRVPPADPPPWQQPQAGSAASSPRHGATAVGSTLVAAAAPPQQKKGRRATSASAPASPAGSAATEQAAAGAGEVPLDFLRRAELGLLPADSDGYHGPERKRQRASLPPQQVAEVQERYRAARRAVHNPPPEPHAERPAPAAPAAAAAAQVSAATEQAAAVPRTHEPPESVSLEGSPRRASPSSAGAVAAADSPRGGAAVRQVQERLHEEAVKVFCIERKARSGAYFRSFAAASYPAVWRRAYCEQPADVERHWYEVVREGRPCHLYLDLEFARELNPEADGDAMVDALVAAVGDHLGLHWGLHLDPACVYELDSSTPTKFSRHLHVRLPGHAFATNAHMGAFVAAAAAAAGTVLAVVRSEYEGGHREYGPFVDAAVYSRNRHFRMAYCTKGGKDAVLLPSGRYATAPGGTTSRAHVLLDTLACNVQPGAKLLQMPASLVRAPGGGGGGGGRPLPSGTVVGGGGGLSVAWKSDAADGRLEEGETAELVQLAERALPFVERAATERAGGEPARARTVAFCGGGGLVAYSLIGPGSHYCENVGRKHTSNHAFLVLNFAAGKFAQKCHDPDCSSFRSTWMPLPPELCLPARTPASSGGNSG